MAPKDTIGLVMIVSPEGELVATRRGVTSSSWAEPRVKSLFILGSKFASWAPSAISMCRPGHRIYPYLLRGLKVERANEVWAMDITYIPMARGFVYLAAVVDTDRRHRLTGLRGVSRQRLGRHQPGAFSTVLATIRAAAALANLLARRLPHYRRKIGCEPINWLEVGPDAAAMLAGALQKASSCGVISRPATNAAVRADKVPEVVRDIGMIRSVARLVDGQRTPVQRLVFRETFSIVEESGKVVEADSQMGVSRGIARLVDRERTPHQSLGH